MVCGHIDTYRILWPDVAKGYRVADEEIINIQELLDMADSKYIVLVTLDMGDRFASPGEVITLADDTAKILLKKRTIKPFQRQKREKQNEVKDGSDN